MPASQRKSKPITKITQLQRRLTNLELMSNNSHAFLLLLTKDHEIIDVNDQVLALVNVKDKRKIIGKKSYQVIYKLDSPIENCPCVPCIKTGKKVETVIKVRGHSFAARARLVKDSNGRQLIVHSLWDIGKRVKLEKRLQRLASYDSLTGLYNRRQFDLLAGKMLSKCKRDKKTAWLHFLDLDKLKGINDRLGHETGDAALKKVASILLKISRKSDVVARLSGDEFVVFAPEGDEPDKGNFTARLQQAINKQNGQGNGYQLSLSVGSATFKKEDNVNIADLLKTADALMYKSKKRKNRKVRKT